MLCQEEAFSLCLYILGEVLVQQNIFDARKVIHDVENFAKIQSVPFR